MKYFKLKFIFIVMIFIGCTKNEITPIPESDDYNLENTSPIALAAMKKLEGIYKLAGGSDGIGSQFVCKVSKSRVSFFSDLDGIFFILKYGLNRPR